MAGGIPQGSSMPGDTEDEVVDLANEVPEPSPQDCIIAVSASGSTPYPCEIARQARALSIPIISISNNINSPLAKMASIGIVLETPPEVLAGSTRLGASTAQKVALNICSTLAGVMMGHVHDGMMVNLLADNVKLKRRAEGIVAKIANVSNRDAVAALSLSDGQTKQAVLIAKGATLREANALLSENNGFLGPCLMALT
jgi:N-acetylmuramic acid 6-phosphate etherase